MTAILVLVAIWLIAAVATALVLGRSIRTADAAEGRGSPVPDFIPLDVVASVEARTRSASSDT